MAKNIPNININTDNFQSWISRTNEFLLTLRTEVLTANSSGGITGSSVAPLVSVLNGSFTANTLAAHSTFRANSSQITFTGVPLNVNGSVGSPGQVLSSNGTSIFWGTPAASGGTVTQVVSGDGLSGGPITASGSIQVRANTGIIANTSGLFVDNDHIRNVVGSGVSVAALEGRTWAAPASIGTTTANTGAFTTLTASAFRLGTTANSVLVLNSTGLTSPGNLDGTTPASSTTGGLRVRARADNTRAYIQITNNNATTEWSNIEITPTMWSLTTDLSIRNGIQVGYRNIPQIVLNNTAAVDTGNSGGQHIYKTTTNSITLTIPDNASNPCPIGTTITFINDAATGNIILAQGGSTILQLGGTLTSGNRTITAGGFATAIKVQTNKWIVSGPGVV